VLLAHELDRDVALIDSRRGERQRAQLLELDGGRAGIGNGFDADYLDVERLDFVSRKNRIGKTFHTGFDLIQRKNLRLVAGRAKRRGDYEIKRDEDYIISLVRCARAFWKHVVDKTPPPPINDEFAAFTIASVVSFVISPGPSNSTDLCPSSTRRIV